jgi:hypothetical protein
MFWRRLMRLRFGRVEGARKRISPSRGVEFYANLFCSRTLLRAAGLSQSKSGRTSAPRLLQAEQMNLGSRSDLAPNTNPGASRKLGSI